MIEESIAWLTASVKTPVGIILLLLVYDPGTVRRLARNVAERKGLLPGETSSEGDRSA